MSVQVYIPTPFRRATNNADRVAVEAPDVKGLLDELEEQFGGLKGLVRNDQGEVHHHVNIYVNNEAIESLQGLETTLKDGDEVSIIPALAGGGPALAAGRPCAGDRGAMILTPEELRRECARRPRPSIPRECCGVMLTRSEPAPDRLLLPCRNIQDELHAQDPAAAPARCADRLLHRPARICSPSGAARRRATGSPPSTTRTSTPARTSRPPTGSNALINGEPAYPDAIYVVLSVRRRAASPTRRAFVWDAARPRLRPHRASGSPERSGRDRELRSALRSRAARDARRRQQPGARLPRRRRHALLRRARRGRAPHRTSTAAPTSTSSARGAR